MDWKQFVTTVVGDLAWPVVVLFSVWLFRGVISQKIRMLSEIQWRGMKANFDEELSAAENQLSQSRHPDQIDTAAVSHTEAVPPLELGEQVDIAPGTVGRIGSIRLKIGDRVVTAFDVQARAQFMVYEAGKSIEAAIDRLATELGQPDGITSMLRLTRMAAQEQIPAELAASTIQLLGLRNQVAHSPDFPIDSGEAG